MIQIGYGFGPKIMYNVSIPLGSLKLPNGEPLYFKYGVIGSTELTDDLETWEHIYVAGRLHKPVLEAAVVRDLQQSRDLVLARVQSAQAQNLRTAARTALLMLPPKFNHMELFSTIAGISYLGPWPLLVLLSFPAFLLLTRHDYTGDVRMAFGENPQKVSNILRHTGNLDKFRSLYHSVIEELQTSHLIQRAGSISDFEQNTSMHDSVIVPSLPQAVRAQCSCSGLYPCFYPPLPRLIDAPTVSVQPPRETTEFNPSRCNASQLASHHSSVKLSSVCERSCDRRS